MFNIDNFNKISNTGKNGIPNIWSYEAGTDELVTVEGIGYFNGLLIGNTAVVQPGDLIYVSASSNGTLLDNAWKLYVVSSITTNVTIQTFIGAGLLVGQGSSTWSGSGTTLAVTVEGVLATDIVLASINGIPTQAAYLAGAVPTTNTITFTLSAANTSNNAVIGWQVIRPSVLG
jgi:hypothetical protein